MLARDISVLAGLGQIIWHRLDKELGNCMQEITGNIIQQE